nr:p51 [Hibiscus green spot virus 2]WKR38963.1 p51 [Hibiscus green spot virus 2]
MIRLLAGLEGGFGVRESGARSRFYTRLLSNGIGMSWLDRLWRGIELIDPLLFELPNFITSFQHEAVPVVRDPVIILVSNMLGANRGRVYTISLGYELGTIDRLSVKSFLCRLFMYVFMQGAEHSVLGCSVVRGVVRRVRGAYYVKLFFGLNEMYLVERYVYGGRRFEFSPPFAVCHVDRYCILSAGHLFDDQSMRFATDPSNLGDMYSMLSSLPRDLFFFSVDSLLLDGTTGFTTDIHIDPVLPVNYSRIVYLDRGTGIMYRSCNRAIPSTAKYHLECAKRGKAVFIVHRLRLVDPIMYEDYEIVGCRPGLFMSCDLGYHGKRFDPFMVAHDRFLVMPSECVPMEDTVCMVLDKMFVEGSDIRCEDVEVLYKRTDGCELALVYVSGFCSVLRFSENFIYSRKRALGLSGVVLWDGPCVVGNNEEWSVTGGVPYWALDEVDDDDPWL